MGEDQVIVVESGKTVVEVSDGDDVRNVVIDSETVSVVSAIQQGPPGPGADKHFEQPFNVTSSVMVIHNLGKKPAVTVIDSAGDEVEGDVMHLSNNSLTASWSGFLVEQYSAISQ